ncbi:hypothetical protein [Phenylobacterium sp.]|uniref:hypothetical protein n=1 Tax=Phenylobacterium sp. TaxID=1871053 RepID=UPI00289E91CF|nr:hypothetical protein [Phenylobacterium sp.]
MTAFSATDAAFEGFRLTRERPKVVLIWAAFLFLVSVCSAVYLISIGQEARAVLEASAAQQSPDPQVFLSTMRDLLPMMVMGLLVQCVMAAAVYRILLRPDDKGFAYLKIGMDELRLAALTFIYVILACITMVVVVLIAALIAAAASFAGQGPAILVGAATEMFFLGMLFYVGVRLSLAPAMTFAQRRIAIFDSWRLTHGQFWRLTGAYVLAICGIVVIAVLVLTIFSALVAVAVGGDIQAVGKMFSPDQTSLASYFSPVMIAYLLVAGWVYAVYYAVVIAPAAVAYRALSQPAAAADAL